MDSSAVLSGTHLLDIEGVSLTKKFDESILTISMLTALDLAQNQVICITFISNF